MTPFSIRQTASACTGQESQSSICTTGDGSSRFKVHIQSAIKQGQGISYGNRFCF